MRVLKSGLASHIRRFLGIHSVEDCLGYRHTTKLQPLGRPRSVVREKIKGVEATEVCSRGKTRPPQQHSHW